MTTWTRIWREKYGGVPCLPGPMLRGELSMWTRLRLIRQSIADCHGIAPGGDRRLLAALEEAWCLVDMKCREFELVEEARQARLF